MSEWIDCPKCGCNHENQCACPEPSVKQPEEEKLTYALFRQHEEYKSGVRKGMGESKPSSNFCDCPDCHTVNCRQANDLALAAYNKLKK